MKNVHHSFLDSKLIFLDCLFCLTTVPKPFQFDIFSLLLWKTEKTPANVHI